ncbi:MAG: BBP7 family outer membrane beta-barrel protein [Gemmataceae bacterium]|nr:BBP7 family outer membrane beta-barrel protein [Gemmataceae bacterium]
MRKVCLASLLVVTLAAPFSFAQKVPAEKVALPPAGVLPQVPGIDVSAPGCADCAADPCVPCFWGSGEYLLWWIKDAPVQTFDADLDSGTFSGGRVTAGGWLNRERTIGLEGTGFLLEQRSAELNTAATAQPVTLPVLGPVTASAAVQSHTRLWGAEANGVISVLRRERFHAELLGGFRFLSLDENLDGQTAAGGAIVGLPVSVLTAANFQTQNKFYGGQLGAKAGGRYGRFSADVIGKVALGTMHEASNLTALATVSVAGFTTAEGIVTRQTRDQLTVLPEVQLQMGYDVTKNSRLYVGYNFLYVNHVLRPGDQTNVIGGVAPFKGTDFWAHGVNFGLELKF